jgi:trk system potassium uptake protein TrkH
MKKLNTKIIFYFMGLLLLCNGGFMLLSALISWIYSDGVTLELSFTGVLVLLIGSILMFATKTHQKEIKKREGYLIVSLGWLFMTLTGMLPYIFTGAISGVTNAFFETMSGYTTTGSSILNDIESLPKGVLFWRSTTNWIGGMGFIVLAVAILPLLGIGGMQLFAAEAPGPSADKLHPRITDTAKRLWYIYVGYTAAGTLFLNLAGMSFFDAINHSMTSISTGGFSTKNLSMAFWNDTPLIQYISILIMFLGGTNFVLSYYAFKGKLSRVIRDYEFRFYSLLILGVSLISGLIIWLKAEVSVSDYHPMVLGEAESAFRHAFFQVVSVITTTGFISADFSNWTPFLTLVFFGLMFVGGSAGSTSGGVKVVRHLLMIKNGILEFKRALHPNAIIPVRYNGRTIQEPIIYNILGFFIIYMLVFIIGSLVLGMLGLDFISAVSGAATALGNIGPGLGVLNPLASFDILPGLGKWWLSFLMLLGRLELFTVLILFTPYFWKRY